MQCKLDFVGRVPRLTYSAYSFVWLANTLSGRDVIAFEDKSL